MKIYTEVNYIWSDDENKLVKTSEESFDYEGPVDQCWVFTAAAVVAALAATKQVYDKNKDYFKGKGPREGEFGKAYRNVKGRYERGREKATENTPENLRKPGGTVKHWSDELRNWEYSSRGKRSPTQSSGDSTTASESVSEPGTKATLAGRSRELDENTGANRRKTFAMSVTNKNPGETAKSLIRRKGGRGSTA